MENIQPFYIGQQVVCVKAPGLLVKGKVYTVLGLLKCKCGQWYVKHTPTDEQNPNDTFPCCQRKVKTFGYRMAKVENFAPIESTFIEVAFEKIVEIEKKLTCAN